MKHLHCDAKQRVWPDPWQMLFVALCALILCSCRSSASLQESIARDVAESHASHAAGYASASSDFAGPQGAPQVPLPSAMVGVSPYPGVPRAWPKDEYLRDGGDQGLPTGVGPEWEVKGLGMDDTVAHYDTLNGQTVVEPSNEVYLYSPRFGAVRQVVGLVANEERQRAGGVDLPMKLDAPTTTQVVANAKQNVQADAGISAQPPVALLGKQFRGVMSTALGPRSFQDRFKAFENLAIIRQGVYEGSETAFLARGSNAAIAWSHTQAVQVVLDRRGAMAEVKYDQSQAVYTVSDPPACPRLRIVKVASTDTAQPGDEVEFTLRFDNVGNQVIGNVTILDSLNTRLEYIADSAQCSVDAKFTTQPNEGDSVVVRCEVTDPLEPGHGAILRFRCRVR